jgi:hypothetical protein
MDSGGMFFAVLFILFSFLTAHNFGHKKVAQINCFQNTNKDETNLGKKFTLLTIV